MEGNVRADGDNPAVAGGSSAQARAVAEGLQADVVTFNQVTDIELLRKAGLVRDDWLGGWDQVNKTHFAEGGILDQVMVARR
jgi:sulfate transport system substrate-binding protein